MASAVSLSNTVAALCVVLAVVYTGSIFASKEDGNVDGKQNFLIPLVPVCQDDEFLTSNGTALICRKLPDVGFCDCPGVNTPLEPPDNNMTGQVTLPLPPTGCPVFSPPTRGAFACLRNPDVIYCSVLCDHRFEFSSTPRNPYFCGPQTNFVWMDLAGGFTHSELPRCAGFRHRLRLLHPSKFYLPSPCYGLSNHTILSILMEFQMLLDYKGCADCAVENTYIQCPSVQASARFYNQITAREDYYIKK